MILLPVTLRVYVHDFAFDYNEMRCLLCPKLQKMHWTFLRTGAMGPSRNHDPNTNKTKATSNFVLKDFM